MKLFHPLSVLVLAACLLASCGKSQDTAATAGKLPAYVAQKGSKYTITLDKTQLEINANIGARITSLKIDGQELLLTADQTKNTIWGNGFWSSPQSEWSWPPVETLDSAPYQAAIIDDRLVFTSKVDKQTGYQFVKSYAVNAKKKCVSIRYSIYNQSSAEKNVAAWEVTRLRPVGIAFFPQGNTEMTSGIFYPVPVEHIGDISWSTYDAKKIHDNHHKLISDGKEGWLAYTDNGKLLVKEFADVPVELMVAGEGEIELFANTEKTYWEIAQQSLMTKLAPGEHLDWEVLWHTRTLPANIKVVQGSDELVSYVRGVLSGSN